MIGNLSDRWGRRKGGLVHVSPRKNGGNESNKFNQ